MLRCDQLKRFFQLLRWKKATFLQDVPASEEFTLSPKKAAYLITDALAPYFLQMLLDDLQREVPFTLQFDETTNNENKKELEIRVIYFSPSKKRVINSHLCTKFIRDGTGETLIENLLECLDRNTLKLKNILTLARDGPNVNKKVARLFAEKLKMLRYKPLLNFRSYYLHIANNGYKKGLNVLSVKVSEFIEHVKRFFDDSDLRWADFEDI